MLWVPYCHLLSFICKILMLVVEINIFLPKLQHLNFEIEQINKWKNNFLLCICLRIKLSRNNRSFSSVLRGCKRRCFLWRVPFKIAKGNSCGILVSTRNTILVSRRSQTVLHIGHPDTEPRAPPVTKEFAAILYNCGHSFLSLFLFFHLSHYEFEKKELFSTIEINSPSGIILILELFLAVVLSYEMFTNIVDVSRWQLWHLLADS